MNYRDVIMIERTLESLSNTDSYKSIAIDHRIIRKLLFC